MWNLKYDTKWTYLQSRNRLTDIENRVVVAKGECVGGGMGWDFGISICKLLYMEWINNKVLLCSTGNYSHYPVIIHNGEEYAWLNHSDVHQQLTHHINQLYFNLSFPGCANGKEPTCQCRRHKRCRFDPWVRKIPWRRAWQPTPVFLPGESHGQRSLAAYSPQSRKESDMTEVT